MLDGRDLLVLKVELDGALGRGDDGVEDGALVKVEGPVFVFARIVEKVDRPGDVLRHVAHRWRPIKERDPGELRRSDGEVGRGDEHRVWAVKNVVDAVEGQLVRGPALALGAFEQLCVVDGKEGEGPPHDDHDAFCWGLRDTSSKRQVQRNRDKETQRRRLTQNGAEPVKQGPQRKVRPAAHSPSLVAVVLCCVVLCCVVLCCVVFFVPQTR